MRCPHCGSYYTPIEETGPSGLKGILGYFLTGGSWLGLCRCFYGRRETIWVLLWLQQKI